MSYEKYLEEVEGVHTVHTDGGFFSYITHNEGMIVTALWIKPEKRNLLEYKKLGDKIAEIVADKGIKIVRASVRVSDTHVSKQLGYLVRMKFEVIGAENGRIILQRNIDV